MRNLFEVVSESFIWAMGITRPKPGKERLAVIYITAILAVTVLAIVGLFLFFVLKH